MIEIYHGVDIVEISKLGRIMKKNSAFIEETFTEAERTYCLSHRNHVVHLAGRFAAKEACLKALGTGLSAGGRDAMRQIEVLNHASGRPEIALKGWIGRVVRSRKIVSTSVSISHSGDYAVASVVMLGNAG
ncbi:MAG: holo-ACP synthase [Nitrospiraceae bacterium]|nr:holo-ACP synthase [Nitrospiraceae bacterium]